MLQEKGGWEKSLTSKKNLNEVKRVIPHILSTKKSALKTPFQIAGIRSSLSLECVKYLFQFHPYLANDLMATAHVVLCTVTLKLLPGSTDREPLFIQ